MTEEFDSMSASKQAVHIMNATNGLCAHPIHYHSFTAVGSSSIFAPAAGVSLLSAPKCLFVGAFHKCIACHNRLGSRPQRNCNDECTSREDSSSGMEMLYCVACGAYAHRSCAFARPRDQNVEGAKTCSDGIMPVCEANRNIVESACVMKSMQQSTPYQPDAEVPMLTESPKSKASSWSLFGRRTVDEIDSKSSPASTEETALPEHNAQINVVDECTDDNTKSDSSDSKSWSLFGRSKIKHCQNNETAPNDFAQQTDGINTSNPLQKNQVDESNQSSSPKDKSPWSMFGRKQVRHCDGSKSEDQVTALSDNTSHACVSEEQSCRDANEIECDSEHPKTWCPHITISRPESPVSWSIFGRKSVGNTAAAACGGTADATATVNAPYDHKVNTRHIEDVSIKHDELSHDHSALEHMLMPEHNATEQTPTADVPPQGAFRTSIEVIRKTTQTTANIPKAYSIGMVAGGVVGLALAGPAGVIVGSQIGKTVLAVGAAVEGGMSIGVLAMSLVAASKYSHKSKYDRELELSGHGCTLVLVRPDVEVDPIWADYTAEARELWEKMNNGLQRSSWGSTVGGLFSSDSNEQTAEIRYHRDVDIIEADVSELAMREKVLLLVNRILNDKLSLPGYVYRYLIRKCIVRGSTNDESPDVCDVSSTSARTCRADARGVIKHVTATLIEVKKGLASSPALTEMTASAVEVLVFGEMYDGVFREIEQQTGVRYQSLLSKVQALHSKFGPAYLDEQVERKLALSDPAMSSLKMIHEAHTSADKLFYAVQFLECVSVHFSAVFQGCMDADALLKMVCQHIIAASELNLYADVAFIEEFSRDEQLLRGKEGYALITLQASLHYLSEVEEFDNDLCPFMSQI